MKPICCRKGGLTRWLAALVIGAMLNVSGLYIGSAFAASHDTSSHKSFSNSSEALEGKSETLFYYGTDPDKVPFAIRADGTKARYISLCPSHIKLQISKTTGIGEVEFRRISPKETLVTYAPTGGDIFSIRSTVSPQASSEREAVVNLALELKGHKVGLSLNSNQSQELPANVGANLQVMRTDAKASDPLLLRLVTEAHTFLNGPAFSGLLPFLRQFYSSPTDCKFDCARGVASCLAAVVAYAGGIGGLILLCPETVGLACVLAIVSHPFLALYVGTECSAAVRTCQDCNNSGGMSTWDSMFGDDFWWNWMLLDDQFEDTGVVWSVS
jgi:hypothetical protein